jgi:hypothetical protein
MNDDYAAERFNVPKLEALDWLKQANLRCGLHWWVAAPAAAKRPVAAPQSAAGKVAAVTMAPTLADLDRKVLSSKLAIRTCLIPVATPRINQLPALAAMLAVGGSFRGVGAVFVDPDTGISRSKAAAYIHPDEIALLAAERHVMIYQHPQRKTIPQLAAHVRATLTTMAPPLRGVECWTRTGTQSLIVWVPRQDQAPQTCRSLFAPRRGLWRKV